MAAGEPLQRAVAEGAPALGQRRAQRLGGDVRRRRQQVPDQLARRRDARRAPVPVQRAGASAGRGAVRPAGAPAPATD
jgi:hypothetical protein